MRVRRLEPSDWDEWRRMRLALWPDEPSAGSDADERCGYEEVERLVAFRKPLTSPADTFR